MSEQVRAILQQPFDGGRVWRAHGIGMLRTYLDDARLVRLNLWHSSLVVPGISTMHTHPWSLHSEVVVGRIINTRWERVRPSDPFSIAYVEDRIPCGAVPDGEFALKGEAKTVYLRAVLHEDMTAGMSYSQKPEEIHTSAFLDGTATVMKRDRADGITEASVFWPLGTLWGDATRDVTADEIVRICSISLALMDRKDWSGGWWNR